MQGPLLPIPAIGNPAAWSILARDRVGVPRGSAIDHLRFYYGVTSILMAVGLVGELESAGPITRLECSDEFSKYPGRPPGVQRFRLSAKESSTDRPEIAVFADTPQFPQRIGAKDGRAKCFFRHSYCQKGDVCNALPRCASPRSAQLLTASGTSACWLQLALMHRDSLRKHTDAQLSCIGGIRNVAKPMDISLKVPTEMECPRLNHS